MGGKAALFLILGFSTIMLMVGLNLNRVSSSVVDNSTNHYELQMAKEIARSGINSAVGNLSRNNSWKPTGSPYSYEGVNNLKIEVRDSGSIKIVNAVGSFGEQSKMVELKIKIASFAEFAYFSNEEGNVYWNAGDSIWGPFHTNDDIQFVGHPYFNGPTTSHGGKVKYKTSQADDEPTIKGIYTPDLTIPIPTTGIDDLEASATSGGYTFSGNSTVYLEFANDSIRYKFSAGDPYTTVLGTDLAPNGIIYAKDAKLRIKGTVSGAWSIGTNKEVFLDDDIVYDNPPDPDDMNDPSTDILGILAKKDIIITDNTENNSDINIHASVYSQDGSFKAENHTTRPVSGDLNLIGGIIQEKRGSMGRFKTIFGIPWKTHGFVKNYRYDSRLLRMVPPYYPSTDTFKILSWLE